MTPLLRCRRLAVRAASSALLSTLSALALAAPAAAADPEPKPGKIVADSGFRPATNGYGFANYGSEPGVVDLGPGQMRRLFGDRVCSSTSDGCTLTPAAQEWMDDQNEAMAGGHCFGMATTAQFFFQGFGTPERPDPFGSPFITELGFDGNERLQRHIARAWATQSLPNVRKTFAGGVPSKVVKLLRLTLDEGRMPYELLMFDDGDGHAISPYAVNRLKKNRFQLLVYDNNYPGKRRALNLNTKKETWRYQIQPGTVWSGNKKTKSLAVGNPRPGIGKNPCPFCRNDPQADENPGNDAAGPDVELRVAGAAPAEQLPDLRVTRAGRTGAVGLGPSGTYNTLRGAEIYQPVTGADSFAGAQQTTLPQITLNARGEYELRVIQPPTGETGPESVTITGGGYSLGADFEHGPGDRATIGFNPLQRRIGFEGDEEELEELLLRWTYNDVEADYSYSISEIEARTGISIDVKVDPNGDRVVIIADGSEAEPVEAVISRTAQGADGQETTVTKSIELDGSGNPTEIEF